MIARAWLAMGLVVAALAPGVAARAEADSGAVLRVLTFNLLQGGGDAANVGFPDRDFGGSRMDELAGVIRLSEAHLVGVQEDAPDERLLNALGGDWRRVGSIYGRLRLTPLPSAEGLTVARAELPDGGSLVIANCHWRPSPYGPYLVQNELLKNGPPNDLAAFERSILDASDKSDGPRGYRQTLDAIEPYMRAGETVVLTGDFNEPSHLDWSTAAAQRGLDRGAKNSTETPPRFAVRWRGSRKLAAAGLRDAYRTARPDEVKQPGNTWTPPYPAGTPGRRPYRDQVFDRIDLIYFAGPNLKIRSAAVVGESSAAADLVYQGRWPSDHRAVLAVFETSR